MNAATISAVVTAIVAALGLVVAVLRGLWVWGVAVRDNTKATQALTGEMQGITAVAAEHSTRLDDHEHRLTKGGL